MLFPWEHHNEKRKLNFFILLVHNSEILCKFAFKFLNANKFV